MPFPDCKFKNKCNFWLPCVCSGTDNVQRCMHIVRTSTEKPIDYTCYHEKSEHLNEIVTTES